jgi:hypothetical protein
MIPPVKVRVKKSSLIFGYKSSFLKRLSASIVRVLLCPASSIGRAPL